MVAELFMFIDSIIEILRPPGSEMETHVLEPAQRNQSPRVWPAEVWQPCAAERPQAAIYQISKLLSKLRCLIWRRHLNMGI